jgi:hypothetical protein
MSDGEKTLWVSFEAWDQIMLLKQKLHLKSQDRVIKMLLDEHQNGMHSGLKTEEIHV